MNSSSLHSGRVRSSLSYQSLINTSHSPFNQFQRFFAPWVIPSYSDRKEKGNSKHPGLPYPLSSTIRTPFSISEPYLHFQYQLPSSSDNPYRKVLTHQNDCQTNSLAIIRIFSPLQLTHIKNCRLTKPRNPYMCDFKKNVQFQK